MSLVDSTLRVKIKKAPSLVNLQLNTLLERANPRTGYYDRIWRKPKLLKESKEVSSREFSYADNSIQLRNIEPDDRIEVELISRKLPAMSLDISSLVVPLRNAVEPFARVLSAFCSIDLFKKNLLSPELSKDSAKVFENAVAWLLSLIGFSVIWLGKSYENISIVGTKYNVGSADIIAYRENEHLLLVDCDTSIPDDRKIRSMAGVADHFKKLQGTKRQPIIVPMIFSPKDCTGISSGVQNVKIIDKQRIESTFGKAMKGNAEQARSDLVNIVGL
jgi:hypothetical protein